jgi:hypothetical protein
VADPPLRSATHRRLGGPLPHQLANAPRAHPAVTAETVFPSRPRRGRKLFGISTGFPELSRSAGQVAHVLLTRPPLNQKEQAPLVPLDLHVLGTPPAFVLSQDQTLHYRKLIAQLLAGVSPSKRTHESLDLVNLISNVSHERFRFEGLCSDCLAATFAKAVRAPRRS